MNLLVNVDVDDLEAAVRFYRSAFGLEVGRRFGSFGVEMLGSSAPVYLLAKEAARSRRRPWHSRAVTRATGRRCISTSSSRTSTPPCSVPSRRAPCWSAPSRAVGGAGSRSWPTRSGKVSVSCSSSGAVAVVAVLGSAGIYVVSERILQRRYDLPPVALAVPTDATSIAEGRRLATLHGCYSGCHGRDATGSVMFDDAVIARIVAPDLTAAVRRYSDAQLALIVRHGLRPDGRSVMVMPAEAYAAMTDEDLGRIVAFLRSLPPANGLAPGVSVGPRPARPGHRSLPDRRPASCAGPRAAACARRDAARYKEVPR
jgi:mono/diheme cytochrome c family protein